MLEKRSIDRCAVKQVSDRCAVKQVSDRCAVGFQKSKDMKEILYVFIGGGCGSVLRFMTSMLWQHIKLHPRFAETLLPWPTLIVNVVGCLLISLFYKYSEQWGLTPEMRLLLTTGFCGGLTTFSTFSYEGIALLREGYVGMYVIYFLLSILLGLAAVALPLLTK